MPENVAILVIHGIGQQAPYETLDQFTQGLLNSFETTGAKCTILPHPDICNDPLREQNHWVRASCHLEFATPVAMRSDNPSSRGQSDRGHYCPYSRGLPFSYKTTLDNR